MSDNKLVYGNIYKQALRLAVPMMIQSGITNVVGLVDNLMVGSLGTESMTAVSIVGQLIFVFNLAIFGGLSGPGIYGAQYYGHGDMQGVKRIFRLKMWICVGCLVMGIIAFLLAGDFMIGLYLQGESGDIDANKTLHLGLQYLDIMLVGLVPFALTQVYATSLRETGESVKPMIAGFVSVVVDIVLNYILIYGKMGFPALGVRGAAIATVCARFVELLVLVIWAHKKAEKHIFLQKIYSTLLVPGELAIPVVKKGFPIFLNEFLWAGGIAVLTQCYSRKGLDVVAGMNISNVLCNLMNVVFVAMGSAVGILVGQMLGASLFKKAEQSALKLTWFTGGLCGILCLVLIGLSGVFPNLYDTSEKVRWYGRYFIIISALFFPVQGILNALYFTLRSGGKTIITFLFDSVFSWVVSVPVAFLLCTKTNLPILMIFAVIQGLDFIKLVVGYILIKKGVWITNLTQMME